MTDAEAQRLLGLNAHLARACRAALPVVKWANLEQSPPGTYDPEERALLKAIVEAEVRYMEVCTVVGHDGQGIGGEWVPIIPEAGQ